MKAISEEAEGLRRDSHIISFIQEGGQAALLRYDSAMRAINIFILCLLFAFQGNLMAMEIKTPCPMGQDMHTATIANSVMEDSGKIGDCCNDAETAAKTGKLCKTGQECSVSSIFLITSIQSPNQEYTATAPFEAGGSFLPSFNPYDIWRPPTLS